MASYRVYVIGQGGRLQQGLQCPDDEAAIAHARELAAGGRPLELWQGGRLVGRLKLGLFTPAGTT